MAQRGPRLREGSDDDLYHNVDLDRPRRHRRWPHRGNLDPLAAVSTRTRATTAAASKQEGERS